jgi:hypothetical protein
MAEEFLRISQLIKKLQHIQDKCGDLRFVNIEYIPDADYCQYEVSPRQIAVVNNPLDYDEYVLIPD